MFAKVFAGPVKASLHCGHAGAEGFGDFRMTAALLHKSQERPILRAELLERMAQGVQFLGVHRAGRLGDVFVLLAKGQENSPQFLAPQLVDAGIARQPEKPGLELRRGLQTVDRPHHLDENLLRQILHVVAAPGHRVDETGDPMLVADNELPLGDLVALLSPPNKIGERGR